jgi:hypothetical protein
VVFRRLIQVSACWDELLGHYSVTGFLHRVFVASASRWLSCT